MSRVLQLRNRSWNLKNINRQGGGIEPLHVSMPLELKSSPSTSPTHLGLCAICWKLIAAKALRDGMRARVSGQNGVLRGHNGCAMSVSLRSKGTRGYGATAARLTPDQKVGSSNLSGLNFHWQLLGRVLSAAARPARPAALAPAEVRVPQLLLALQLCGSSPCIAA